MGRWQTLLASGVAVAALASAAPGDGATLVYRDGAGNLRGAAADGSRTVGYTADASPGGKQYIAPSVDDRGSVVVAAPVPDQDGRRTFQVLNNAGALWAGPYSLDPITCSTTPFQSAIDPNGRVVAFTYFWTKPGVGDCSRPDTWSPRTTVVALGDASSAQIEDMYAPAWTRLPEPGIMGIIGFDVFFQPMIGGIPEGAPRLVVENPNPAEIHFLGVDPHPAGGRILVEAEEIGPGGQSTGRDHALILFQSPSAGWDRASWVCSVSLTKSAAGSASRPRHSPDGALMSWTATDGIRLAAAPMTDPAHIGRPPLDVGCLLPQERLAIAGGRDAAWTPASLPSPAPPPPPAPAPQPPPAPPTVTATARPKAPGVTLRRAGKRVQMRLRLGAPALAGRAVDLQIRGKRWVRVARVARVPANGRINRHLLVPTHLLRGRASLRVRVVVRPSPVALGATGAVRAVGVPGPLRVPNLRRPK